MSSLKPFHSAAYNPHHRSLPPRRLFSTLPVGNARTCGQQCPYTLMGHKSVKSLFGYNGSFPFPHTNGPFPSVLKRREGRFHSRNGHPTERSYFCQTGPKRFSPIKSHSCLCFPTPFFFSFPFLKLSYNSLTALIQITYVH